jgi:imidazoleglycerol-phosphate dehydratase
MRQTKEQDVSGESGGLSGGMSRSSGICPVRRSEMARIAEVERYTKETSIEVQLNLDGSGQTQIDTGVGFFDHMLDGMARHGLFDLTVKVDGDLTVDDHHTIEDTGIVIGQAIRKAVGDKKGIQRYGSRILPMDEVLVLCAVDLCGRPSFSYDAVFQGDRMGTMSTQMVREFFYAISYSAMMNLHLKVLTPGNDHHMAEAMFKAFGKALDEATRIDPRITDVLSTKGTI